MFLDPSGQHLFIAFASHKDKKSLSEVMYLHTQTTVPKEVPRLSSQIVTAIAWNPTQLNDFNSKAINQYQLLPILVGTSKGLIFELEITSSGEIKVSKQVIT